MVKTLRRPGIHLSSYQPKNIYKNPQLPSHLTGKDEKLSPEPGNEAGMSAVAAFLTLSAGRWPGLWPRKINKRHTDGKGRSKMISVCWGRDCACTQESTEKTP